jgi:hypothetical protein
MTELYENGDYICWHFILFDEYVRYGGNQNIETIRGLLKINKSINSDGVNNSDLNNIIELLNRTDDVYKKMNLMLRSYDFENINKNIFYSEKNIDLFINKNEYGTSFWTDRQNIILKTLEEGYNLENSGIHRIHPLQKNFINYLINDIKIPKIEYNSSDEEKSRYDYEEPVFNHYKLTLNDNETFISIYKNFLKQKMKIEINTLNLNQDKYIIPFGFRNHNNGHAVNILIDNDNKIISYANSGLGLTKKDLIDKNKRIYNGIVSKKINNDTLVDMFLEAYLYVRYKHGNIDYVYKILNKYFNDNLEYNELEEQISGTCTYHSTLYLIKKFLKNDSKFNEYKNTITIKAMEQFLSKLEELKKQNQIDENIRNYLFVLQSKINYCDRIKSNSYYKNSQSLNTNNKNLVNLLNFSYYENIKNYNFLGKDSIFSFDEQVISVNRKIKEKYFLAKNEYTDDNKNVIIEEVLNYINNLKFPEFDKEKKYVWEKNINILKYEQLLAVDNIEIIIKNIYLDDKIRNIKEINNGINFLVSIFGKYLKLNWIKCMFWWNENQIYSIAKNRSLSYYTNNEFWREIPFYEYYSICADNYSFNMYKNKINISTVFPLILLLLILRNNYRDIFIDIRNIDYSNIEIKKRVNILLANNNILYVSEEDEIFLYHLINSILSEKKIIPTTYHSSVNYELPFISKILNIDRIINSESDILNKVEKIIFPILLLFATGFNENYSFWAKLCYVDVNNESENPNKYITNSIINSDDNDLNLKISFKNTNEKYLFDITNEVKFTKNKCEFVFYYKVKESVEKIKSIERKLELIDKGTEIFVDLIHNYTDKKYIIDTDKESFILAMNNNHKTMLHFDVNKYMLHIPFQTIKSIINNFEIKLINNDILEKDPIMYDNLEDMKKINDNTIFSYNDGKVCIYSDFSWDISSLNLELFSQKIDMYPESFAIYVIYRLINYDLNQEILIKFYDYVYSKVKNLDLKEYNNFTKNNHIYMIYLFLINLIDKEIDDDTIIKYIIDNINKPSYGYGNNMKKTDIYRYYKYAFVIMYEKKLGQFISMLTTNAKNETLDKINNQNETVDNIIFPFIKTKENTYFMFKEYLKEYNNNWINDTILEEMLFKRSSSNMNIFNYQMSDLSFNLNLETFVQTQNGISVENYIMNEIHLYFYNEKYEIKKLKDYSMKNLLPFFNYEKEGEILSFVGNSNKKFIFFTKYKYNNNYIGFYVEKKETSDELEKIKIFLDNKFEDVVLDSTNSMMNRWIYNIPFNFIIKNKKFLFFDFDFAELKQKEYINTNFTFTDNESTWWIERKDEHEHEDKNEDINFDKKIIKRTKKAYIINFTYNYLDIESGDFESFKKYYELCNIYSKTECIYAIINKYYNIINNLNNNEKNKKDEKDENDINSIYWRFFKSKIGNGDIKEWSDDENIVMEIINNRNDTPYVNLYRKELIINNQKTDDEIMSQNIIEIENINNCDECGKCNECDECNGCIGCVLDKIVKLDLYIQRKFSENSSAEKIGCSISREIEKFILIENKLTIRTKYLLTNFNEKNKKYKIQQITENFNELVNNLDKIYNKCFKIISNFLFKHMIFNNLKIENLVIEKMELFYKLLDLKLLKLTIDNIRDIFLQNKNIDDNISKSIIEIYNIINKTNFVDIKLKNSDMILFEIFFGFYVRKDQYSIYQSILNSNYNNTSKKINQLLMGKGKTSVIVPLLTLYNLLIKDNIQNIYLITKNELIEQSFNDMVEKYSILINFAKIIKEKKGKEIEMFENQNTNNKNIFIINDSSYKRYILNKYDRNKSFMGLNSYDLKKETTFFIIDEFDSIYEPLASDFNLPSDKKKISEIISLDEINNIILHIINDMIGKSNSSNQEIKIKINQTDICKMIINNYESTKNTVLYNKDYGFPFEGSHNKELENYAVPYQYAFSPIKGSTFSDVISNIVLTIMAHISFISVNKKPTFNNFIFIVEHLYALFKNLTEDILNIHGTNIQNKLQIYLDLFNLDDLFLMKNVIIKCKYDKEYIKNVYKNLNDNENIIINSSILFFEYIVRNIEFNEYNHNLSSVDLISNSLMKYKCGFSGTVNIILPQYESSIDEFESVEEDDFANGSILHSILCEGKITVDKIQKGTPSTILDNVIENLIQNKYDSFIDQAGFFRNQKSDNIIMEISKKIKNKKYFIYITHDNIKKVYIPEYNKIIDYNMEIYKQEDVFIYYDNKHVVGIDIKQPTILKGVVSINNTSRFTDVSQAIFRLRKLNNGHTISFMTYAEENTNLINRNDILKLLLKNERSYIESSYVVFLKQNISMLLKNKSMSNCKIKVFNPLNNSKGNISEELLLYYNSEFCNQNNKKDPLIQNLCSQLNIFYSRLNVTLLRQTQEQQQHEQEQEQEQQQEQQQEQEQQQQKALEKRIEINVGFNERGINSDRGPSCNIFDNRPNGNYFIENYFNKIPKCHIYNNLYVTFLGISWLCYYNKEGIIKPVHQTDDRENYNLKYSRTYDWGILWHNTYEGQYKENKRYIYYAKNKNDYLILSPLEADVFYRETNIIPNQIPIFNKYEYNNIFELLICILIGKDITLIEYLLILIYYINNKSIYANNLKNIILFFQESLSLHYFIFNLKDFDEIIKNIDSRIDENNVKKFIENMMDNSKFIELTRYNDEAIKIYKSEEIVRILLNKIVEYMRNNFFSTILDNKNVDIDLYANKFYEFDKEKEIDIFKYALNIGCKFNDINWANAIDKFNEEFWKNLFQIYKFDDIVKTWGDNTWGSIFRSELNIWKEVSKKILTKDYIGDIVKIWKYKSLANLEKIQGVSIWESMFAKEYFGELMKSLHNEVWIRLVDSNMSMMFWENLVDMDYFSSIAKNWDNHIWFKFLTKIESNTIGEKILNKNEFYYLVKTWKDIEWRHFFNKFPKENMNILLWDNLIRKNNFENIVNSWNNSVWEGMFKNNNSDLFWGNLVDKNYFYDIIKKWGYNWNNIIVNIKSNVFWGKIIDKDYFNELIKKIRDYEKTSFFKKIESEIFWEKIIDKDYFDEIIKNLEDYEIKSNGFWEKIIDKEYICERLEKIRSWNNFIKNIDSSVFWDKFSDKECFDSIVNKWSAYEWNKLLEKNNLNILWEKIKQKIDKKTISIERLYNKEEIKEKIINNKLQGGYKKKFLKYKNKINR